MRTLIETPVGSRPEVATGAEMVSLMQELFPICRSITGDGLRQSLRTIGELLPLDVTEVPSGTAVLDWVVPPEWNIRAGWLTDPSGQRVVDFDRSNLSVLNYSVPVHQTLTLEELRPHLHSLPDHPSWVPYRTSYYNEDWGFCLPDDVLRTLPPGHYEAVIDSSLEAGSLTYGECVLPGSSSEEILISGHICHPSLANDNLSGVVVAAFLAKALAARERRYTYRFLFAPGTIGAIAWLAHNEASIGRIRGGLVLACVGDEGEIVYKRSRQGDSSIDRAAEHVLKTGEGAHSVVDFSPYGNDERQFCSPGFNLPIGSITRSNYERAERHHTSADDIASISPEALAETLRVCLTILEVLEADDTFVNLSPKGEPQLGRRGLYRTFGGRADRPQLEAALLWLLSFADGRNSLLDIAVRAELPFAPVREAALLLEEAELLGRKDVRS
jgi:aminopeptidase-like protein